MNKLLNMLTDDYITRAKLLELVQDLYEIAFNQFPQNFRFIAVMHAESDGVVPGNALVVDPKKQFRPLTKFGNAFLNRFQCSSTNCDVLKGKLMCCSSSLKSFTMRNNFFCCYEPRVKFVFQADSIC